MQLGKLYPIKGVYARFIRETSCYRFFQVSCHYKDGKAYTYKVLKE